MELKDYGTVTDVHVDSRSDGARVKHTYTLFIPHGHDASRPSAVLLHFDEANIVLAKPLMDMVAKGKAPNFIMIGLPQGVLVPPSEGSNEIGMRCMEYDDFGADYPNYVVDELFPFIEKNHGIEISREPIHMVGGGSSGGCCAWNFLWFRNDMFRRGFISSPSFLHMRNMNRYLELIRKFEPKPIRVAVTVGEHEPDEHFGSSYIAGHAMDRALKHAGYDYIFRYFPGGGHCANFYDQDLSVEIVNYLYSDYPADITPRYNERFCKLVETELPWEAASEMPERVRAVIGQREYTCEGGKIFLTENGETTVAAHGFSDLRALALSGDKWRLYLADRDSSSLFAVCVEPDGSISNKLVQTQLEPYAGHYPKGACDLCVDERGRIFAATQLGVQMITVFGMVDAIMPAPDGKEITEIAFGGEDNMYLYVKTESGIFRRKMKTAGRKEDTPYLEPTSAGYYDI